MITNSKGTGNPSKMAEGIALQRFAESKLPEDERIFYDPYAIHFIDKRTLEWAKNHPLEAKALADEYERKMPGWSNSIRARIRYFDDVIENAVKENFNQLVILGAGYDTRAYRISALKERIKIFEIDRPETIERKTGIITKIFGELPDNVTFVSLDLEHDNIWEKLEKSGYSRDLKTLFVLEGLLMYLPHDSVSSLFAEIVRNSYEGSLVLFDFIPQSLVDGTFDSEGGSNIREYAAMTGEPFRSGFSDKEVGLFLSGLGFSDVNVISSSVYGGLYSNKSAIRHVSGLLLFASANV